MTTQPKTNNCEMLSSVDFTSPVAVYLQIENHIQFGISSGRLKPGERLPSVRELSERLKVNPNTVAKAYRDLEVLGLLYTRRGMGVFVNKGVEGKSREVCWKRIVERLDEIAADARAAGITLEEIAPVVKKCFASAGEPQSSGRRG